MRAPHCCIPGSAFTFCGGCIMVETQVVVTFGREKLEISVKENMTFGELRQVVEGRTGSVEGGLRLLHKGKSFPDKTTLESAGAKSGTKMMALRTKKQLDADRDRIKREKFTRDIKSMAEMKERAGRSEARSASGASSSEKQGILGDEAVEGRTSLFLIRGRSKYRVNIDLSSSVLALKENASKMEGIDSEPRDMKLLFKGKFLEDGKSLSECGAKDGVSLVLLFSARHHDAKEDLAEIGSIEQKVVALELKAKSLISKAQHRFLDEVDLSIAKGDAEEELLRLKDNLSSVKSEDERKPDIERKLSEITVMLSSLK